MDYKRLPNFGSLFLFYDVFIGLNRLTLRASLELILLLDSQPGPARSAKPISRI